MNFLPKLSIETYHDMLLKIAYFTGFFVYLLTFFVRQEPDIDVFFSNIESFIPLDSLLTLMGINLNNADLNLFGIIIGFIYAILSYALQIHDRISDLFRIRKSFDIYNIIYPMIILTSSKLRSTNLYNIALQRRSIMQLIFYKYASSRKNETLVDKHDIISALTTWSWIWILIEVTSIMFLVCLTMIILGYGENTPWLFLISFLFLMLVSILYEDCKKHASSEIEQILNNQSARHDIKSYLESI